mgnify:FL=1
MVRFKNRYLLCEFNWHDERVDETLTELAVVSVFRNEFALNFGDVGSGAFMGSVNVKYWNPVCGIAVVRVGRDIYRKLWASMTLLREIKGRSVAVRVLHVGSTLRSSQNASIERIESKYEKLTRRGVMPGGARAVSKNKTDAARLIHALQP